MAKCFSVTSQMRKTGFPDRDTSVCDGRVQLYSGQAVYTCTILITCDNWSVDCLPESRYFIYPKLDNWFPLQTSTEQVYPRVDKSYSLPKSR